MKKIGFMVMLALALAGCDKVREKLHMLPNQDEQQCLNSEALNFKDPGVLFVANLGDRGVKLKPEQYWVRYKARNSYGSYVQGNMLCEHDKTAGKWVRSKTDEFLQLLDLQVNVMERANKRLAAGDEEMREELRYKNFEKWARGQAEEILFTSPEPLSGFLQAASDAK